MVEWLAALRRLARESPTLAVGGGTLLLIAALGLVAPWIAPHDPLAIAPTNSL